MANVFETERQGDDGGYSISGKPGEKKGQNDISAEEILGSIRDLSRRIRVIEERYGNIRKSIQVNEQNMLADSRKNSAEIKSVSGDILELKKTIREIGEELGQIIKELKTAVKKEEVKVLERYINLWQPMNYVTYEEMEKRIKAIVKEEISKAGKRS
jgi:septation ring formation regulator EzrA